MKSSGGLRSARARGVFHEMLHTLFYNCMRMYAAMWWRMWAITAGHLQDSLNAILSPVIFCLTVRICVHRLIAAAEIPIIGRYP
jgi:hypothetical protein